MDISKYVENEGRKRGLRGMEGKGEESTLRLRNAPMTLRRAPACLISWMHSVASQHQPPPIPSTEELLMSPGGAVVVRRVVVM